MEDDGAAIDVVREGVRACAVLVPLGGRVDRDVERNMERRDRGRRGLRGGEAVVLREELPQRLAVVAPRAGGKAIAGRDGVVERVVRGT